MYHLTIPPHEDQPNFAPTIAIIGPSLPDDIFPAAIKINSNPPIGSIVLSPTEPLPFFEPFSRNSYWRRQRKCITLSKTSEYITAVWSEADVRIGKYAIVVGDRDIRGRNPSFTSKLKSYWTPTQSQPEIKGLPAWERFAYWFRKSLNR